MSSTLDRLVYSVNQIARNLATHTDPTAATADHIATFWDPRMKTMIEDHRVLGGEGLSPVSRAALDQLAVSGAPAPQSEATAFDATKAGGGADAG